MNGVKVYESTDLMTPDLTQLNPLTTQLVVECLEKRYTESRFYTKAGSAIIAINPFCPHPYLYDYTAIRRYHHHGGSRASSRHNLAPTHPLHYDADTTNGGGGGGGSERDCSPLSSTCSSSSCSLEQLPPHVFAVAETAYSNQLQSCHADQSVIVSGESGAGKTVTASHIIKYLVTVANPVGGTGVRIEQRILDSGPILQAFGNAATLRNHNSSRFGKYIQLHFNRKGCVDGASIKTYLLEKTRVVYQADGECSFHVFYQLLEGARSTPSLQQYLTVHGHHLAHTVFPNLRHREKVMSVGREYSNDVDMEQWNSLRSALQTFGLEVDDQMHIFKLLLGLLHLSAVSISHDPDDPEFCFINTDPSDTSDCTPGFFHTAVELLGLCGGADDDAGAGAAGVEKALTHRRITASHNGAGTGRRRHSVFYKPCTAAEASERRDCLIKLIYARLFDWLVERMNHSIHCAGDVYKTIAILDIYGFESFPSNGLEQLCINFANEKLQQHFVRHFLKDMQEEYEREAIPWTFTHFVDNRPCLELLEGANTQPGVFGILNEECAMNRSGFTDSNLERRILGVGERKYIKPGKNTQSSGFTIKHYAGHVHYHISGLLEKNKDNVAVELMEVVERSKNPFIQQLFPPLQHTQTSSPTRKRKTVLAKFKQSVCELMSALQLTSPHYIRCIKPNLTSEPGRLDRSYVLSQLEACGVLETVNVSKQGYPAKMMYEDFHRQYSVLLRYGNYAAAAAAVASIDSVLSTDENKNLSDDALMLEPIDILYKKQMDLPVKKSTPVKKLSRRTGYSSSDHTRKLCASIMQQAFGVPSSTLHAQFGRTKIFLKQGQLEELEEQRDEVLEHCACTIQYAWIYRNNKTRRHRAALTIQKVARGWLARLYVKRKEEERKRQEKERVREQEETAKLSAGEMIDETFPLKDSSASSLSSSASCMDQHSLRRRRTSVAEESLLLVHQATNTEDRGRGEGERGDYSSVWRLVAEAFREGHRCTMTAAFTGIPYFEAQQGILSRRRMPRVAVKFHTRVNQVLKFGHQWHKKERQCSITDCLPDQHLMDLQCARLDSLTTGLTTSSVCVS